MAEEIDFENRNFWNFKSHVTLTLTSDDLESHIIVNVSSTLTNSNIWFVAALSLIVDVRMDVRTDIFTGFIRSSRRRRPKNEKKHTHTHNHFMVALWTSSGTTRVTRFKKKHSPTYTYRGHQSSFICFIHLLWSMASSLFNRRTWQYFSTISLQVFFGLPLGLAPSTSYMPIPLQPDSL